MNFWTFLDRNAFWFFVLALFVVLGFDDCKGQHHGIEGCGVKITSGADVPK